MTMSSTNPPPQLPLPGPNQRRRDLVLLLGLVGLVLAGLLALAAATGWQDTWAQIGKLELAQIAILLGLSIANYLLRGCRWHIFARRLGIGTTFFQNLRHYLGGFAMIATPGRVGELVRMRWIRRETGWTFEKTAPLVLVDRASDLAGMAIILGVAIILSKNQIFGAVPVSLLALAAAILSTRPRLLVMVADFGYRMVRRWPRQFARIRTAARSLEKFSNPLVMGSATVLCITGWFAEAYGFHLLLFWMGADVSLTTAAAIFVFATIAGGATGAPGGVGGAEAAMVALLTLEGVPIEVSLAATAVIRLTTLWFAIGLGLTIFPFAERLSMKVKNDLE